MVDVKINEINTATKLNEITDGMKSKVGWGSRTFCKDGQNFSMNDLVFMLANVCKEDKESDQLERTILDRIVHLDKEAEEAKNETYITSFVITIKRFALRLIGGYDRSSVLKQLSQDLPKIETEQAIASSDVLNSILDDEANLDLMKMIQEHGNKPEFMNALFKVLFSSKLPFREIMEKANECPFPEKTVMEGVFKEHAVKFMFDPANGIVKMGIAPIREGEELQAVVLTIDLKELCDEGSFLEGAASILCEGVLSTCEDVKSSWQDAKDHEAPNLLGVPPGVVLLLENGPSNPGEYVPLFEELSEPSGNILSLEASSVGDLKMLSRPKKRSLRYATWGCVRSNPLMHKFDFPMQRRTEKAIQPLLLQAANTVEDSDKIEKVLITPTAPDEVKPAEVSSQSPLLKAIVGEKKNEELQQLITEQGKDKQFLTDLLSQLSKVPLNEIENRMNLYDFPDKELLFEVRATQFAQIIENVGILKVETSILPIKESEILFDNVIVDCDAIGAIPSMLDGVNAAMNMCGTRIQENWIADFETTSPNMPNIPFGMGVNLVSTKPSNTVPFIPGSAAPSNIISLTCNQKEGEMSTLEEDALEPTLNFLRKQDMPCNIQLPFSARFAKQTGPAIDIATRRGRRIVRDPFQINDTFSRRSQMTAGQWRAKRAVSSKYSKIGSFRRSKRW